MSIRALEWSRKIRVGDPHAKAVLRAISDYAGDDGACWPSLGTIADDVELSIDTVRRRVRDLETLGLLVRIERHTPEGRRTSDEIRLRLDVGAVSLGPAESARMADHPCGVNESAGHAPDAGQGDSAAPTLAASKGPLADSQGDPGTPARVTLAVGPGLESSEPSLEPSEEPLPPTPLRGEEGGLAPDWQEFNRAWSAEVAAIEKPVSAERLFRAFTAEERARIRRSVPIYGEFLRRTGRKALAAHTFLREKTFESYQPGGEAAAITSRNFVETGTPEWRAWEAFYRFLGRGAPPLTRLDGRPGWWFATALPPVDAAAAGTFVELGTPQWMCWKKFLAPSLSAVGMDAPRHAPLPADFAGPKVLRPAHPQPVRGWLFPSEWPPARGSPAQAA